MCGMTIVPRLLIRDIINKTGLYKPGVGLPQNILETYIKPIYADLSDDKLLNKCRKMPMRALILWSGTGFAKMELGVYDAVAHFNLGKVTVGNVFIH